MTYIILLQLNTYFFYIYTGIHFENQFIYWDRFLEFHFFIKKRVGRGIANILLINEVTICIEKRGFLHWKAQFTIWGPCRKVCAVLQRPWRNAYMQKQVNKVVNMYFLTYKCLNLTFINLAEPYFLPSLSFDPYPFLPQLSPKAIKVLLPLVNPLPIPKVLRYSL